MSSRKSEQSGIGVQALIFGYSELRSSYFNSSNFKQLGPEIIEIYKKLCDPYYNFK
jgi:hypothetical protein